MRFFIGVILAAGVMGGSGISGGVPATQAIVTANVDQTRTGWFSQEPTLNLTNVGAGHFGSLFSWNVVSRSSAQLLIAPGVVTSAGQKDLLIATTLGGNIYAFDANNPSVTPVWSASFGPGFSNSGSQLLYGETASCLSTPAIDLANSLLYAVCANNTPVWKLYKLNLATGATITSTTVTGQYPGTGDPNGGDTVVGGQLQFFPSQELQRAGLMLANGNVYIGFGSQSDVRPWHGWLFAYAQSNLAQVAVFCTSPSNYGAGVWGSGAGVSVNASGQLYAFTGNGGYDGATAWGQSILKFSSTLSLLDWFTPSNWATLESNDSDLSSSRAMLMTTSNGSPLLVGGAKDFRVYSLDSTCMGHLQGSGSGCPSPQLFYTTMGSPGNHVGIYGGVFANNAAYFSVTQDAGGLIYAFSFSPSTGLWNQTPVTNGTTFANPGAQMSYSSNGAFNGVLWAITTATSAETSGTHAVLRAFNPSTLTEVYNSDTVFADELQQCNKFNPPLIWRGHVFVGTQNAVMMFGLGAH